MLGKGSDFLNGKKLLDDALAALQGLDVNQRLAVHGKLQPELVARLLDENKPDRYFNINHWRLLSEADNLRLVVGAEALSAINVLNQSRCLTVIDLLRTWGGRQLNAVLTLEDDEGYLEACERIVQEVNEQVQALGVLSADADLENFIKVATVQKMQAYFRERRENLAAYMDKHTGLLTKDFTIRYVKQLLAQNIPTALLAFDMTKLGPINEALEMVVTDRLLGKFFESLAGAARSEDSFSWGKDGEDGPPSQLQRRQAGGDEGQMVFVGIDNLQNLKIVMSRVYEQMARPVELEISEDEWRDVMKKYEALEKKRRAYKDAMKRGARGLEELGGPEKLTSKEEGALELIPDLRRQVEEQSLSGCGGGYVLKIKLGMRLGGKILDPPGEEVKDVGGCFNYLEGLIGKAKTLQQSRRLIDPLIVEDQSGEQWVISAEDLLFRSLETAEKS